MSELHDLVNEVLNDLPANKQTVLKMRYGIDHKQCTAEEIAQILDLSIARIYVIQKEALRSLRRPSIYSEQLMYYLDD